MSSASGLVDRIGAVVRQPTTWWQLLKFGIVGGSGYLINLVVFALLADRLGIHPAAAAVGAFCVAVTNNFLWNRYWTFGAATSAAAFQAARFFTVSVASLGINLTALEALVVATQLRNLEAQAIAVALAMPFNFLGNKLWTFV